MSSIVRKLTVAAVSLSLCAGSTVAVASEPVAPSAKGSSVTGFAPTTVSPWLTLSAMSGSSTAAAAALSAQEEYEAEGAGFPPLPVLAVIIATIAVGVWILVDEDDGDIEVDLSPD